MFKYYNKINKVKKLLYKIIAAWINAQTKVTVRITRLAVIWSLWSTWLFKSLLEKAFLLLMAFL